MMKEEKTPRKFDLEDRLVDLAVTLTEIAESLPDTRTGNHIAGQLIRSGTSPALNYGEAVKSISTARKNKSKEL